MSALATLRGYLQSTLRDSTNATWTTTEMDNALTRAINTMYPRIAKQVDATGSNSDITLVEGDYFYTPDTTYLEIDKIEWVDSDSNERGELAAGTWEHDRTNNVLHIAPSIADAGGTLRIYGYTAYTSSDTIPDRYDPLVMAKAEVELLHMLKVDRARFQQWANTSQTQNVSVNELMQMVNGAEQRARELTAQFFTFRRPRPGRR